jgi:UbiD family decarboxylase
MAALAANPNIKIAIVVDEDIDIYDEQRVLWAIATTFEADRDLAIIPNAMGSHLNPAAYGEVRSETGPMNTKVIIDATRPATLPFEEAIKPPQEAWNRIRLEDYLD